MLFAVIAGLLAVAAAWWIVRPLFAAAPPAMASSRDPAAEYRAALDALAVDERAGLMTSDAAQGERAALARELLREDEAGDWTQTAARPPLRGMAMALLALAPVMAGGLYLLAGGNLMLAGRAPVAVSPEMRDVETVARRLSERVTRQPDDAEGYRALGVALTLLGRSREAAQAYGAAIALGGGSPDTLAAYGEALTVSQQGMSADALDAFNRALAGNPDQPTALLFRGQARLETKDLEGARDDWRRLLALTPQDAPWRAQLSEHLAIVERRIAEVASVPEGGADIAALDPSARQAAIEGMVAGLAERLEREPDDLDGWRKLIRSYTVLGETQKASAARSRAEAIFKDNPDALAKLKS